MRKKALLSYIIDIRGFTGLETPNELHNRGALTDAHAHAALIIINRCEKRSIFTPFKAVKVIFFPYSSQNSTSKLRGRY